ncbi:hypothetical protein T484DRAFT_1758125 [Baffinella frigidus]|nr:hypothetical protein T484DRAFT_1758125 [Cryptophyta sp. CCMP2293]
MQSSYPLGKTCTRKKGKALSAPKSNHKGKRPESSAHEKRDTAPECKRNGTQVIERNTIQSATSKGDSPPARPPRHECETRPRTNVSDAQRHTRLSGNATHARVDVDPLHADTGVEVLTQPRGTTGATWKSSRSREERRGAACKSSSSREERRGRTMQHMAARKRAKEAAR